MIEIGAYNTLVINRNTSVGYFLEDIDTEEEVLLPQKYRTESMDIGQEIDVFVYKDSSDRVVATTERPLALANEFAFMEVAEVNDIGAFLDWGLEEKQLLVPYRNQAHKMKVGERYLVYVYEDRDTDRLVATSKLKGFLDDQVEDDEYERGDEVDLIIRSFSDIGMNVVVDQMYSGLIYKSDLYKKYEIGQSLKGYVGLVRPDGKLDIKLNPIGHNSIEPNAQKVLEVIEDNDGFLGLNDKSSPDEIRSTLNMSKKLFKKAIGSLYKQQLITIEEDGVRLV